MRSKVLPFVQRRLMCRYQLWCTALWSATARQHFSSWRCSKKQSRWQSFQTLVLEFACTCILHRSFIYFACVILIHLFMIICGLKNSRIILISNLYTAEHFKFLFFFKLCVFKAGPLEGTLLIFGRRALIWKLFENMKIDTTFVCMHSCDHLGDAKMLKKGSLLRQISLFH